MRRRDFISLIIGGATAAWPLAAHVQQRDMPVVGVLCAGTAEALERYVASFREGMRQLGYIEGSNIRLHGPLVAATLTQRHFDRENYVCEGGGSERPREDTF